MKAFEKIAQFRDLDGLLNNVWLGSTGEVDGVTRVDLYWRDVLALVAELEAMQEALHQSDQRVRSIHHENEELIEMCVKARAETDSLRAVLEAVHKDLRDRADPDGTVAVGASVWIDLDNAVKGGA
ncbi:hypothetical protein [Thalassospira sp. UBA1131]|uniref:hypothetical protein n=1 Tax=Thalassospira sp. UBA1131 TaxID=1947672 RepID=UPI0025F56074|nr:hypothetical protein [Thalassospira sp. UBA1131]